MKIAKAAGRLAATASVARLARSGNNFSRKLPFSLSHYNARIRLSLYPCTQLPVLTEQY